MDRLPGVALVRIEEKAEATLSKHCRHGHSCRPQTVVWISPPNGRGRAADGGLRRIGVKLGSLDLASESKKFNHEGHEAHEEGSRHMDRR